MRADELISVGDVFFKEDPVKNRFRLIEHAQREVQKDGQAFAQRLTVIEDLLPNKLGTRYEISYRKERQTYQFDHIVTFSFGAENLAKESYTVKENESFTVMVNGKSYECRLTKVDMGEGPHTKPLAVEVEWTDGENKATRRMAN